MPPAARLGDMHLCPRVNPGTPPIPHVGGPIFTCATNVIIEGLMAARQGDKALCIGPPDSISKGSSTVKIGGKKAARMGDSCAHGGTVVMGACTVFIGG